MVAPGAFGAVVTAVQQGLPMVAPVPVLPEGIDYRNCSVETLLEWCVQHLGREWLGCQLVFADPPWRYNNTGVNGAAEDHYPTMPTAAIVDDIAMAGSVCGDGAYLALWITGPFLDEWFEKVEKHRSAGGYWPWRYLSAGCWFKPGTGAGHHWRGNCEFVLLYERGGAAPKKTKPPLSNACYDERTEHSEKPIGWQAEIIEHFVEPGGQVLSLYEGRATVSRACLWTGRRCVSAEVSEKRWTEGMGLIAGRVGVGFPRRSGGGEE